MSQKNTQNFLGFAGLLLLVVGLIFALAGGQSRLVAPGLITASAIFFGLWQFGEQRHRAYSLTLVDTAIECFKQATEIIEQSQPSRANWVVAARTAQAGVLAARQLSEPDHIAKFDATAMQYRLRIWAALQNRPVEFFWCQEDDGTLPENIRERTEELAKRAYYRVDSSDYESQGSTGNFDFMSDTSLYALIDAAKVPEGFEVPLDRFRGKDHWLPLGPEYTGLRSFLLFQRRKWVTPGGVLDRPTDQ